MALVRDNGDDGRPGINIRILLWINIIDKSINTVLKDYISISIFTRLDLLVENLYKCGLGELFCYYYYA